MNSCGNCVHWRSVALRAGKVGAGQCHFNPPTVVMVMTMSPEGPKMVPASCFPSVEKDESGCSHFQSGVVLDG